LHGFLGSGEDWSGIAKQLLANYCIYALDLPGHGLTRHSERVQEILAHYTMEVASHTVLECLEAMNIEQIYLVGYSMGGRLALYLTLCYPTLFRRAVILSATAGLKTEEERAERVKHDEAIAKRLEMEASEDFLRFWYEQPLFAPFREHPSFVRVVKQRLFTESANAAKALRGMGTGVQPPVWDVLGSNRVPIVFAAGERDAKFVALAQEMHVATPFSTLAILPNAGHVVHHEAAMEVASLLARHFV
jgi:2-succinyl-6-hydroxy-2,4-cyclohexadiene-1-carboxylate synthase